MRQQSTSVVLTWQQKLAPVTEPAFAVFCLLQKIRDYLVASHEAKGRYGHFLLGFLLLFVLNITPVGAVPAGIDITNTASLTFSVNGQQRSVSSNTVSDTTVPEGTTASIRLLSYNPDGALQVFADTDYQDSGGTFVSLPAPVPFGTTTPLDSSTPQPLVEEERFHVGEPIFIEVADNDQNLNDAAIDVVTITVTASNGDTEILRLYETAANSGVFVGYVISAGTAGNNYDGILQLEPNGSFSVSYDDGGLTLATSTASVDPEGIVFDSRTRQLVSGATVSLIDATTGQLAVVYGDDGVSTFPNPIVAGSTVTDSSGVVYSFSEGAYRFPVVMPGTYRLEVDPPPGFVFPSQFTDLDLAGLQARSLYLEEGIRGEDFVVDGSHVIPLKAKDIPLDAVAVDLFLTKTANRTQVGIGDYVQYQISMDNSASTLPTDVITITDVLPKGFRYQKNATFLNGVKYTEPEISDDGRTLQWQLTGLAGSSTEQLSYVVEVVAGSSLGKAVNQVSASSESGLTSNVAEAAVYVRDELFMNKGFLLGRVILGSCDADVANDLAGVEGARVLLEDGTYVITDAEGKWHVEGVSPGTHVVQLDLDSLPENYEVVACEKNTAFAGSAFSQFVDLKPGMIWRNDFYVRPKPPKQTDIKQKLSTWFSSETTAEVELTLDAGNVAVNNMRAMLNLPNGWVYVEGTATLDGEPVTTMQQAGNTLIFNLGEYQQRWQRQVHLQMQRLENGSTDAAMEVRATGMYSTATQKNGRLPVISNFVTSTNKPTESTESTTRIQEQAVESISKQTEKIAEREEEYKQFDDAWLEKADSDIDMLYPSETYTPAIPAIRVGVKHQPGYQVKLKLNGEEVSPLNFFGTDKNAADMVAISRWQGIDLRDGDNQLEAIVYNQKGLEVKYIRRNVHYSGEPIYAEILPEMSYLVADGKTSPVVAVWFMDKAGYPARYGVIGDYDISAPYKAQNVVNDEKAGKLLNYSAESRPRFQIENGGIAYIRLQPTTQAGEAVLNFKLNNKQQALRAWIEPGKRDWVFVGFAEGVIGKHMNSGDKDWLAQQGKEDGGYTDGRVAFYAKGQVKGEWLLTAAYDTGKDVGDKLGQEVDPDQYYTLYGDDTVQQYDAESSKKLYLKLEKQRFYALFGDFDTGLTVTELGRYNRSLTGVKTEYQDEKWQVNAFAAPTDQSFIRDEIRGDGTSGLYHLSREDLLMNTEKVTIQVRDRYRSEVIISEEAQTRHVDYNIDYDNGTLWFRSPIASRDDDLNPVYIIVEYETADQQDERITAGGRVAYRLDDDKRVGMMVIHEGNKGQQGQLLAVDTAVKINDAVSIKAEMARSQTDINRVDADGNAYVAELTHANRVSDTTVYLRSMDSDFGLGQQNLSETGMRKMGVENTYRFNEQWDAETEAYRHHNLESDADRDVLESRANFKQKRYNLYAGGRYARDSFVDTDDFRSAQLLLGGNWKTEGGRLTLRSDVELQLDRDAMQENSDFTDRVLFGADYALTKALDVFATQEFSFAEAEDSRSTLVGLRARPWTGAEMSSSMEQQAVADSERLVSNLGFTQNLHWGKGWSADFLFDRSSTLSNRNTGQGQVNPDQAVLLGSNSDDYYALSTGLGYSRQVFEWSSRLEYRNSESSEKWNFGSGYYRSLSEGVAVASSVRYLRSEDEENGDRETTIDLQTSFAWRPVASKLIVLEKLDLILDKQEIEQADSRAEKIVQNMHAFYKHSFAHQLGLQYSAKYVFDTIDEQSYKGYTDFLDLEYRYYINESWDLGTHAGSLRSWQAGVQENTYGVSVGFSPYRNIWLNLGYNYQGFRDDDFSAANYTNKGVYLQFRMKFNQLSLRDMLKDFSDWSF